MLTAVRQNDSIELLHSDGIMIPKVQNPTQSNLADYRVSGNVEGKLLCSMMAQRFYQQLATRNNLIDKMF